MSYSRPSRLCDETTLQQALASWWKPNCCTSGDCRPGRYFFKHALIQETAYQSLLKSKRQQYHQQIAQVLEERFPETQETQPELLAHHYTEAGLIAQAIPYWQQAGQRAVQRSANIEAIGHLTNGLELLKTLPDTPERTQQELTLQIILGVPLRATKGYAATEVEQTYKRALNCASRWGRLRSSSRCCTDCLRFISCGQSYKTAHELAEQLLSVAQTPARPGAPPRGPPGTGADLVPSRGEFALAREHFEQGIALYDPQKHRSHAFAYAGDPGVICLEQRTNCLVASWLSGPGCKEEPRSNHSSPGGISSF